jgi:hypothetical protein
MRPQSALHEDEVDFLSVSVVCMCLGRHQRRLHHRDAGTNTAYKPRNTVLKTTAKSATIPGNSVETKPSQHVLIASSRTLLLTAANYFN